MLKLLFWFLAGLHVTALAQLAPVVTAQPVSLKTVASSNVSFEVQTAGSPPITYQWYRNETGVPAGTNSLLSISNVQPAHTGRYQVVAANGFGVVTSQVAILDVETAFTRISTGPIPAAFLNSGTGIAWGDYDGDGFLDVVMPDIIGHFVFRNNGDGTFADTRVSSQISNSNGGSPHAVVFADYDNDGRLDVFITKVSLNNAELDDQLFRNLGNGQFERISGPETAVVNDRVPTHAAAWADYDGDGRVDLFVGRLNGASRLYHNDGGNRFTLATPSVIAQDPGGTAGCAWSDYDNDGDLDLFVCDDTSITAIRLYRNEGGGAFSAMTGVAIVPQMGTLRACAWGDYDNDGDADLFVANNVYPAERTSFLYRNDAGVFTDVIRSSINLPVGISAGDSFDVAWVDYDNDGFLDLFVLNRDQPNLLYRNRGDGTFATMTNAITTSGSELEGACAWGDYDNDGFMDLVISGRNCRLFHNDGNSNSWIRVRCEGRDSNRSAIGAKIRVNAVIGGTNRWQLREISGGSGNGSQHSLVQNIGLGDATNIALLRVEWPSRRITELKNVPVNRLLVLTEPVDVLTAVEGRGSVNVSPAGESFTNGMPVTLSATPANPAWTRFLHWSDGNTNAVRTVQIGVSNQFTAIFTNFVELEELIFKQWDAAWGGTNDDQLIASSRTLDGGYLLAGNSRSMLGAGKTATNFGDYDFWLVWCDSLGRTVWQASFGGAGRDLAAAVIATADGGFLVGGTSSSGVDGNKLSPNLGGDDYWVIKVGPTGAKEWEKTFGGGGADSLQTITSTRDGGCLLVGSSTSNMGGMKTGASYGGSDFWLLRLSPNGQILWQRSCGGTGDDTPRSALETPSGAFLIGGYSESSSGGTKSTAGYGGRDYWVVKLDANGNQLWERTFGGSANDTLSALAPTARGGYLLAGTSFSDASGNKTSPGVGADGWLVDIDAAGNKLNERSLTGSGTDTIVSMVNASDGGFFVAGQSDSGPGGDKSALNRGGEDYWLVRLLSGTTTRWNATFGGTTNDSLAQVIASGTNGLLLAGSSQSFVSGNKTAPGAGERDYWVVSTISREAPVGAPVVLVNGQYSSSNRFFIPDTNTITVEIQSTYNNAQIYYATNVPAANFNSRRYTTGVPLSITQSVYLRAIAYTSSNLAVFQQSEPIQISIVPTYRIATATPGGGEVALNPSGGTYLSNTVVTLSAIPSNGWSFIRWEGTLEQSNNPLTLTVTQALAARAIFGTDVRTPVYDGIGAVLRWPPSPPYEYGSTLRLTGLPATGYYLGAWLGDTLISTSNPVDYLIREAGLELGAFFFPIDGHYFTLTTPPQGAGSITRSPDNSFYAPNTAVQLTATPDPGWVFTGWSGDTTSAANPLTVQLTGDRVIQANFVRANLSNAPPRIAWVSPADGETYVAPANVLLKVHATDSDGAVVEVRFFAGTNYLGFGTPSPVDPSVFSMVWSNPFPSTYSLIAQAIDDQGMKAVSTNLSISIALPSPTVRFATNQLFVNEGDGVVKVRVIKTGSQAVSFGYYTVDGSARFLTNFLWDYWPAIGTTRIESGESFTDIVIPIGEDYLAEPDEWFTVQLTQPGDGVELASPATVTVNIRDNDAGADTRSLLQFLPPIAISKSNLVSLQVVLTNGGGRGQWRFPWDRFWRDSGSTAGGLEPAGRVIGYNRLPGFQEPPPETNSATSNLVLVRGYGLDTNVLETGIVQVNLLPLEHATNFAWRLSGEQAWRDAGTTVAVQVGVHLIEFRDAASRLWQTPLSQNVRVLPDMVSEINGAYHEMHEPPPTVSLPKALLGFESIQGGLTRNPQRGYSFVGQLQSPAGLGSGFVVSERVVLTAAHVVFDDVDLTMTPYVYWFPQRHAGEYEPRPLRAKGWFVMDGYREQRMAERMAGAAPGQAGLGSQVLDVAALWFDEPADRLGSGGCLVSGPGGADYLGQANQFLILGYPTTGPTGRIQPGRIHEIEFFAAGFSGFGFSPVLGDSRLMESPAFQSFGGNSGGPVAVPFDVSPLSPDSYYPAGVYIGSDGTNSRVRTIDTNVLHLINLAASASKLATNIIDPGPPDPDLGPIPPPRAPRPTLELTVDLGPSDARVSGAGWRFVGETAYRTDSSITLTLNTGLSYTQEFRSASGFFTPPKRLLDLCQSDLPATMRIIQDYAPWPRLVMHFDPASAVSAGASWRFHGEASFVNNPVLPRAFRPSNYVEEFRAATNFFRPTDLALDLSTNTSDQEVHWTNRYEPLPSLRVNLGPQSALAAGAGWRFKGETPFRAAAVTNLTLNPSNYTVEFRAATNFFRPGDQSIALAGATSFRAIVLDAIYQSYPQLTVTLSPPEALAAGGAWRFVGQSAWNSNAAVSRTLAPSNYVIEFRSITNFFTPSNRPVNLGGVTNFQDFIVNTTYESFPRLRVTLSPPEALRYGAAWRLVGSTNWNSDMVATQTLAPANQTIEFRPATAYFTPSNVPINLAGITGFRETNVNAQYQPPWLIIRSNGLTFLNAPPGLRFNIESRIGWSNNTPWINLRSVTSALGPVLVPLPPRTNRSQFFQVVHTNQPGR